MPSKRKQSKENESSLVIKKTRTDIVPVSEKVITVRKVISYAAAAYSCKTALGK